jgi:hypothetical protein
MMVEARRALFLAAAALGLAGCTGAENARALDRICGKYLYGGLTCTVDGVGRSTTGLTGDSIGFSIDDATLVVHLAAVDDLRGPGPFDVALLTIARFPGTDVDTQLTWGSCEGGCPADPPLSTVRLPTEYAWVTVATGIHGAAAGAKVPYDAVMSFTATELDIADLRITATP